VRRDLANHADGGDADPVVEDDHVGLEESDDVHEVRVLLGLADDFEALTFEDESQQSSSCRPTLADHDPDVPA
jgi:hypothetical protein